MRVLSWAQAQASAFAGASERGQGSAARLSVREAIDRYKADLQLRIRCGITESG